MENLMAVYGYVRVSTSTQDIEKQRYEILNYALARNLKVEEIVEEVVSGKSSYNERALGRLLEKLKKNDILIVTEFSRLGRKLMEVMDILHRLMQGHVKLYITKGNLELGDNIQSKVLAFAFGLAAEIERELISARTKEALAKLKAENKPVGRPKGSLSKSKLDGKESEIDRYLSKKISIASICKLLEVAPSTFYSFCQNRGIDVWKYQG